MPNLWPLLIAGSVGAMGVQAAPVESYELLVGSYTAGPSQGIYRLSFDSRTGQIDAKPLQVNRSKAPVDGACNLLLMRLISANATKHFKAPTLES